MFDKKTVFVAMPCGKENPYPEVVFNAIYQKVDDDVEIVFDMNSITMGQQVHHARNCLLERFIQSDYDYLWFLDSDNPPSIDVLDKLLKADKDVVSAIVPLRCWDKEANLLNIFYQDEQWNRKHYTDLTKEKEQVIEITNCWTGCVLMKRNICEDMYNAYKWHPFDWTYQEYVFNKKLNRGEKFDFQQLRKNQDDYLYDEHWEIVKQEISLSEDITFFERAKELWYKLYADITAICVHFNWRPWKRVLLNKDLWQWKSQS